MVINYAIWGISMFDLDRINICNCRSERKLTKKEKRHLSRVVSTCAFYGYITWDRSRHIREGEYCQGMINRFRPLGGIGNRSSLVGCENYVGCCAEQHAANALILKCPVIVNSLSDICFSKARRARTLEIIKPCKNCKMLFTL